MVRVNPRASAQPVGCAAGVPAAPVVPVAAAAGPVVPKDRLISEGAERVGAQWAYSRYENLLNLRRWIHASTPDLPTIAVISDIHGNARRLVQIMESDVVKNAGYTVYLGDYFDRDPHSIEVFEVLSQRSRPNDVFLWGNHEYQFMMAMMGYKEAFFYWMVNGGFEFLEGIFGSPNLRGRFDELSEKNPNSTYVEIFEKVDNDYRQDTDNLFLRARTSERLQDVYNWLVESAHICYVDEYAMGHFHAGMRFCRRLDVSYFDRLRGFEDEFKGCLKEKSQESLCSAYMIAKKFRHHMEMRERHWLKGYVRRGPEWVAQCLSMLGIRGVVYGHSIGTDVRNTFDRFFNVDLAMTGYYGGLGGVLEIGPSGISSHRFVSVKSDELVPREIVDKSTFQHMIAADVGMLIPHFEEYLK